MIKLAPDVLAKGDQGLAVLTYAINAMTDNHRHLIAQNTDPTTAWALECVRIQEFYTELNDPATAIQSLSVTLAAAISMLANKENPTP